MGSKTVFYSFDADKDREQVKSAMKKSLMLLGGSFVEFGDGFQIKDGNNGISSGFTANFEAIVNLNEKANNKWEMIASITWSPNGLFWICLILGFFLVLPWIVNIMFLFIDPTQAYQQVLFRVQGLID